MLNEERVILMTKMASYEANEGKEHIKIGSYFRSDYVALQLLKALVYGTVAFIMIVSLFLFYDFEAYMQDIYALDLISIARALLVNYAVFIVGYGLAVYGISVYRYAKAKRNLRIYYQNLKKLNAMYHEG